MNRIITTNKEFYRKLIAITVPIAAQNFISFALNMLDTLMLGNLGETQIAASGLANQPYFIFTMIIFGIASGCTILCSQYWGRRDTETMGKILSMGMLISVSISLVTTATILIIPEKIMFIYTKDTTVIRLGADYLRIVGISYLLSSVSALYLSVIRAAEQVRIALKVNIIALCVNAVLNYVFIFGKLGFPAMGIHGAAIATLIARIVEFTIVIYIIKSKNAVIPLRLKNFIHINKVLLHDFLKYALPVLINELLWSIGASMYSVIFGNLGANVTAAFSIANVFERLATVVLFGIANATVIILGQELGRNNEKQAFLYAKTLMIIVTALGILSGIMLVIINPFVFKIYKISAETTLYARQMLYVMSVALVFKSFNCTSIVGIIRSGGDTKFSLFVDTTGLWLVGVPLGAILAFVFHMPPYIVYIGFMVDEVYKTLLCSWRIFSKKWIKNITRENKELL